MFALELDGLDETSARLDGLSGRARRGARRQGGRARGGARRPGQERQALRRRAQRALRRAAAIRSSPSVSADGDGVLASVGSNGDVKYAAIQEYGGKTRAHEILPVKAQALAFVAGGAQRFARKVEHPGSLIPERSYLRSSLDEMSDEIVAALADAAAEAWERA